MFKSINSFKKVYRLFFTVVRCELFCYYNHVSYETAGTQKIVGCAYLVRNDQFKTQKLNCLEKSVFLQEVE